MHTRRRTFQHALAFAFLPILAACAHEAVPTRASRTIASPHVNSLAVRERQCGNVTLPETLHANGRSLVLNGMAIKRVTFLRLEVFVSGLYLEHEMRDVDDVLGSQENRRLVLRFVRHVSRSQLERGLRWALERNASEEFEAHAAEFDALLAALPAFSDGDELAFDQRAGGGFHVLVNGRMRANFASPEFARLCLLAFLGPNGNLGLRLGLIGGRCNQ
jgi:hypothetical protein